MLYKYITLCVKLVQILHCVEECNYRTVGTQLFTVLKCHYNQGITIFTLSELLVDYLKYLF